MTDDKGKNTWDAEYDKRINGKKTNKNNDHRNPYQIDANRILHSFAFRRLQGKMQVVNISQSDFHRTRMTHSIEVASIAKHIFLNIHSRYTVTEDEISQFLNNQKNKDIESLLFAIGLAHDMGHPPFGHGGEIALNYLMRDDGGFESNAQTLRLLTENTDDNFDLTKRTLLGLLKYPMKYKDACKKILPDKPEKNRQLKHELWIPPKCYYNDGDNLVCNELLSCFSRGDKELFFTNKNDATDDQHGKSKHKSFDCSIMEAADDIAYSIHDLEDAIFFKKISLKHKKPLKDILKKYYSDDDAGSLVDQLLNDNTQTVKIAISTLVNDAITNLEIHAHPGFTDPLLKYSVCYNNSKYNLVIDGLKNFFFDEVIMSNDVQAIVHNGMLRIMQVFEALLSNPKKLLPRSYHDIIDEQELNRSLCDYISGMTDEYLTKFHKRLYGTSTLNMYGWF